MLGLYELWRRWFVRLWNRKKHRVMEYRYEYKDAVDNRERYVYPKKECECDCLGVDKLEYNGELPDVHLDNKEDEFKTVTTGGLTPEQVKEFKDKVRKLEMGYTSIHFNTFGKGFHSDPNIMGSTTMCEEYMRRGNKRYFRGHNVKVIVTVEE